MNINVCGDERISVVSPLQKRINQEVGTTSNRYDISKLFTNSDDNCPINNYEVFASTSGTRLSSENSRVVKISGSELAINYDSEADFILYLKANSASGAHAF